MRYTFDLTEQDYLDFNMFTVKNYVFYQKRKKLFNIIFTILPFATGFAVWFFEKRKSLEIDFIVGFFVAVIPLTILFWIGFPRFFDALTLRNAKKILLKEGKNNILGERTISFEDNKIRKGSKRKTSEYASYIFDTFLIAERKYQACKILHDSPHHKGNCYRNEDT